MSSVPERPDRAIFDSIVSWRTDGGGDWIGEDADGKEYHVALSRDLSEAARERRWAELARRDPEGARRLSDIMARLMLSNVRRLADELAAEGFTAEQVRANPPRADEPRESYLIRLRAAAEAGQPSEGSPAPKSKRTRRPSPSKLAKWEAAWQAEQSGAETES